jgi:hypothetical protein
MTTSTLATVPQICQMHNLPLEATRRILRRNPDLAKRARGFGVQRVFDADATAMIVELVRAHKKKYATWHPVEEATA